MHNGSLLDTCDIPNCDRKSSHYIILERFYVTQNKTLHLCVNCYESIKKAVKDA